MCSRDAVVPVLPAVYVLALVGGRPEGGRSRDGDAAMAAASASGSNCQLVIDSARAAGVAQSPRRLATGPSLPCPSCRRCTSDRPLQRPAALSRVVHVPRVAEVEQCVPRAERVRCRNEAPAPGARSRQPWRHGRSIAPAPSFERCRRRWPAWRQVRPRPHMWTLTSISVIRIYQLGSCSCASSTSPYPAAPCLHRASHCPSACGRRQAVSAQ